jgi:hypothetical protein
LSSFNIVAVLSIHFLRYLRARESGIRKISLPQPHYGQEVQEKIKVGTTKAPFRPGSASHNEQVMKKPAGLDGSDIGAVRGLSSRLAAIFDQRPERSS